MTTPNELQAWLRGRISVRQFSDAPIHPDVIERILETAVHAPSAHNRQPWRFAVVAQAEARARLAEAMASVFRRDLEADGLRAEEQDAVVERSRQRIVSAPLAVTLCMELTDMDRYPDERRTQAERTMAIQSVANAGATLLLAVHAEGLGGVWVCAPLFAPQAVSTALDLPPTWEPQALLLVGQPAGLPRPRPRRSIGDVTVYR